MITTKMNKSERQYGGKNKQLNLKKSLSTQVSPKPYAEIKAKQKHTKRKIYTTPFKKKKKLKNQPINQLLPTDKPRIDKQKKKIPHAHMNVHTTCTCTQ